MRNVSTRSLRIKFDFCSAGFAHAFGDSTEMTLHDGTPVGQIAATTYDSALK